MDEESGEGETLTGGCACRSIRYVLSGAPGFSFHCQCRSCQYLSGTGHASAFICRSDDLGLSGKLTWYDRPAPSGNTVKSGFCPTCGTHVLNENTGFADNFFLTAATLDDPSQFNPTKVLYRDEGHHWDLVDPES
ncbi:MAG: GFA family protein [Rhizobiaceae bacterium]